jgi:hypothetical protein
MFGSRVVCSIDIVPGYIKILHPYIIHIPEGCSIWLVQTSTDWCCCTGENQTQSAFRYRSILASIRDIQDLMSSCEILNDSHVYSQLMAAKELTRTMTFVMRGRSGYGS